MKDKEFNLSEKMWFGVNDLIQAKDVKEFIKILEENKVCADCHDNPCNCGRKDWVVGLQTIKELAGDKLIEGKK